MLPRPVLSFTKYPSCAADGGSNPGGGRDALGGNGGFDFVILGGYRVNNLRRMHIRDMDGLVVCAVDRHHRRRVFEPWFPRLSRGPSATPQPPPPSTSCSTIGTAGGWVACLVVIFLHLCHVVTFLHICYASHQKPTARHLQQRAPPPSAGASLRHILLRLGGGGGGFEPVTPRRQAVALPLHCGGQEHQLWDPCPGFLQADGTGSHRRSNRRTIQGH